MTRFARTFAVVTAGTYLRFASWLHVFAALTVGLIVGVCMTALPSPSLAADVFDVALQLGAALLIVPLAAALPADERRGGYEALLAIRPIPSAAWALGRLTGAAAGALLLLAVVHLAGRAVAWNVAVPLSVPGTRVESSEAGLDSWRFAMRPDSEGPFDLTVDTLMPYGGTSELTLDVSRGAERTSLARRTRPQRRVTVALPDLAPARGDLYVDLRAGRGLLLGASPPRLTVGTRPLGAGWPADAAARRSERHGLERLLLMLAAAVAAASAFRFETACLAGVLAGVLPLPEPALYWTSLILVAGVAVFGTALTRRQAMP